MAATIMIIGGGDLSSGVAVRLAHCGARIFICELPNPLAVRRRVAFAEAVYSGTVDIEGLQGERVDSAAEANACLERGRVPVLIDPQGTMLEQMKPLVVVDGRMTKRTPHLRMDCAGLVIGLGPGFVTGVHCHAVIETMRGPFLGRVIWQGGAEPDTGLPERVANHQADRVLRAPVAGVLRAHAEIGDVIQAGQVIAEVAGQPVLANFTGVLRGLVHDGLAVTQGLKIGDLDARLDPRLAWLVSEKALAIGGGVLEAILTRADIRSQIWGGG